MHCLTVNLAQALIKVHHPYSSAVSFQLDLSSVRFNIALDRHMLKPTADRRNRQSTANALRIPPSRTSTPPAVQYGPESGYLLGADDVSRLDTPSSRALSQRQSMLSSVTATTSGTTSKRR
ncbi:hypothetical protein SARC_00526 [Sphaeroforma arctica JP610]|uniref:Uncharacterized protein n=1 Tax=Sphaeroforma arctica JP610 TaxID=667725 RepID=A0A0L0GE92_9EUKA|nr:hypothetical protein SARC_00526 [Sphaeroforma arctica JP610]KNC87335.1 hypothetical protein SARC_00526 [Sphaeroforma arctica JP610]|eukprot:XP_014161237.1 hypothetical protein SARC_00526 [Sphaeroforma arctica JP610]